jgi:hypothetical protein
VAQPDDLIVLRAVRERTPGSAGIAWFSQGQVSHIGAILPPDHEFAGCELGARIDHVGGKPGGVQIRPADYAHFTRRLFIEIPCTTLQRQSFYAFLLSQEDKPYDWRAILAFATNRDWRELDSWICSELITAASESADLFDADLYLASNKVTPVMCVMVHSTIKGRRIIKAGPNY